MSLEGGKKWIAVLDYILDELQPEVIVPGHGEVYNRARAKSQQEYFKALIHQVEQNYKPGIKNKELIAKINVSKYIDHRPRLGWIMAVNGMVGQLKKKIKRSAILRFIHFISTLTPATVLIPVSYPPEMPVDYVLCIDRRRYKTLCHIPGEADSDNLSALQIVS